MHLPAPVSREIYVVSPVSWQQQSGLSLCGRELCTSQVCEESENIIDRCGCSSLCYVSPYLTCSCLCMGMDPGGIREINPLYIWLGEDILCNPSPHNSVMNWVVLHYTNYHD